MRKHTEATKELRKLFGPKVSIRDSGVASSPEARAATRAAYMDLRTARDELEKKMLARQKELLEADPIYMALLTGVKAHREAMRDVPGLGHYRYEALADFGFYQRVEALGDSVEDLLANARTRKGAA